jgi:hypothetical protein
VTARAIVVGGTQVVGTAAAGSVTQCRIGHAVVSIWYA